MLVSGENNRGVEQQELSSNQLCKDRSRTRANLVKEVKTACGRTQGLKRWPLGRGAGRPVKAWEEEVFFTKSHLMHFNFYKYL